MFKLTLRLFLVLFVVKSVSSITCYQADLSKCPDKDPAKLYPCLNTHVESTKCRPDQNICVGIDYSDFTNKVKLRTCGRLGGPNDHCNEALHTFLNKENPNSRQLQLQKKQESSCNYCKYDNCNTAEQTYISSSISKDLKESKKASDAKKNGGNRSHRITVMHKMAILVHVVLLLFPLF